MCFLHQTCMITKIPFSVVEVRVKGKWKAGETTGIQKEGQDEF